MQKITIRGIRFDNVDMDGALLLAKAALENEGVTSVVTPNAEIAQMCLEDTSLSEIINAAEIILPDGAGVVMASEILGTPLRGKVAGVEFGENVLKGISFLVDLGMKNPVLSEQPALKEICYDHAVATYALCEAYTFCKQMDIPSISNLEKVVVKAVDRIIDAQCPNGGWGYSYNNKINPDIDLSVTGWNVQALKAAEHGGIKPTKGEIRSTLRKASSYVRKNVMPDGKFSYKENGNMPRSSLVGVGVLSLQMTGDGSGGAARKGLDWIKNNVKTLQWGQGSGTENVKSNLYMHYYCVQAAMNRGGDVWTSYNKAFRDAVLSGQNADGSFRKNDVGYVSGMSNKSENIYRQCLATLMLETYYRFLPGTGEGTKNS